MPTRRKSDNKDYEPLILLLTSILSKRSGIKVNQVFFSFKDFQAAHPCTKWESEYGICCGDCNSICVNIASHNDDISEMIDTVAHEILHLTTDMDHGREFKKMVKDMIKGKGKKK